MNTPILTAGYEVGRIEAVSINDIINDMCYVSGKHGSKHEQF